MKTNPVLLALIDDTEKTLNTLQFAKVLTRELSAHLHLFYTGFSGKTQSQILESLPFDMLAELVPTTWHALEKKKKTQ